MHGLNHNRRLLFAREFDSVEMQALAGVLGDVDRFGQKTLLDAGETVKAYPHYRGLLEGAERNDAFIKKYLPQISPVLQGPFPLPDDQVINGPWSGHYKLEGFPACGMTPEFVEGKRVLDVGCNAGFDSFYLVAVGAAEVVGVEPSAFYFQASFLGALYNCPNVRFVKCGWQALGREAFGTFDVVNCQGILYHEPDMFALLVRLVNMLAVGGTLVLETHVTLKRTMSATYVSGAFWATRTGSGSPISTPSKRCCAPLG